MSNNQFDFKKRMRPEWYTNGPVKVFTPEEISEWEKNRDPTIDFKRSMQENLSEADIKFLDDLKTWQAEDTMEDIMQGFKEGGSQSEGDI